MAGWIQWLKFTVHDGHIEEGCTKSAIECQENNKSTRLGSNPGRLLHKRTFPPFVLAVLFVNIIKQIKYN